MTPRLVDAAAVVRAGEFAVSEDWFAAASTAFPKGVTTVSRTATEPSPDRDRTRAR
ncbi:hypothetical protein H7J93_07830 [Mycobacterium barrassiae]|uniref:hypothetical protein n=1 Tax=Mycobacterium barrassiae TaxID=319709 RepID=UPI002265C5D9|nr:hypothetical protein [Mycobacterium barrassiae]MCV7299540.1 hypothetical protein [Mycobacterium barrassiae]